MIKFYWSGELLKDYASKRKDIPVTIGHPAINGQFLSVWHNSVTKATIVGRVSDAV